MKNRMGVSYPEKKGKKIYIIPKQKKAKVKYICPTCDYVSFMTGVCPTCHCELEMQKVKTKKPVKEKKIKHIHREIYCEFYHIGIDNDKLCEIPGCSKYINDIHHIFGRHKCTEKIEFLIGLCRDHHNDAGDNKFTKEELVEIHKKNMNFYEKYVKSNNFAKPDETH